MVCDTRPRKNQTLAARKEEVKKIVTELDKAIAAQQVKVRVGQLGGIAFEGISTEARGDVTDACIYRRIMTSGSALAQAEIARAEQMAGRSVDRKVLAGGLHSHDGGKHWHKGH
jgi:hypothetical protein